MDDDALVAVLDAAAAAVAAALGSIDDWGLAGTRAGQYRSDLAADAAASGVLVSAGMGVLSEESGLTGPMPDDGGTCVVLDPLDGSTNASRGVPWYATSLCAVDADGARAALVVNLATGERFEAVRGAGARRDGRPMAPSTATEVAEAMVGLSGYPPRWFGWHQYRALGAAALDMCSVGAGRLDAYVDCSRNAHGVWDYAAACLICTEAGAVVADAHGRDLLVLEHDARRTPVAAATPALLAAVVDARNAAVGDAPVPPGRVPAPGPVNPS